MAENRVIGAHGALPWRLPADLRRFRRLTMGKPVVMGRRTHASIGRPLPGRANIVLTRDEGYRSEGCRVVHSVAAALGAAGEVADETMVIGGAEVYRQFLPLADRIELTVVRCTFDGDTRFPDLDEREWTEVRRVVHGRDAENRLPYDFRRLERVTAGRRRSPR